MLHELAPAFSKSKNDLGTTDRVQHEMKMPGASAVKQHPRRFPLAMHQAAKAELQRMLDLGVVVPSTSSWASPIVLVTKSDGSLRFCADFRVVNNLTVKDSYPLPQIDNTIDALRGAKWFSTLDLASGYWQVRMDPRYAEKTAFTTPFGLYEFIVMPFGLANAPATFERLIESVLAGVHWEICLIYLDDVIVFSTTFEEHVDRLRKVITRIHKAGLKITSQKCQLFRRQVDFLGYVVSDEGISTDPKKTDIIRNWPTPDLSLM